MRPYVIMTDGSCDLPYSLLKKWNVSVVPLSCMMDGIQTDSLQAVYQGMREGKSIKTSAANLGDFEQAFLPVLQQEKDILFLSVASALSNTFSIGQSAAGFMKETFPERRIEIVDTRNVCLGLGYLVFLAVQQKNRGCSLDQTLSFLQPAIDHMIALFTVDDLMYLKKGGRIGSATAIAGGLLKIHPILKVNEKGSVESVANVRGMKKAIRCIGKLFLSQSDDPKQNIFFIAHANDREKAKQLNQFLREETGTDAYLIADIGPVVGAHAGPGTVALFYLRNEREVLQNSELA